MSADDTLTVGPLDSLTGESGLLSAPALTIIWHPHLDRVGQIAPLTNLIEAEVAHVSRTEPLFFIPGSESGEPLAHRFISAKPVLDISFKRGTFELRRVQDDHVDVDGQPLSTPRRVSEPDLRRGLIITLARRIVLCLHSVHFPISRSPTLGLLGTSDAIEDVRRAITRQASKNTLVLLRGESGTGKELAAHALHHAGPRAARPFLVKNMALLGRDRAEADLFGHKKGGFTGAIADSPGLFRSAAGGTVFLDEIGDTAPEVQRMILRVIDDKEVTPLGASEPVKVDVRIVAATDAQLEKAKAEDRFHQALYNRLTSGFVIKLPPLRERREDVGVLLLHLLKKELRNPSILQRLQETDHKVRPWLAPRDVAAVSRSPLAANVRSLLGLARKLADAIDEGPQRNTHAIVEEFLAESAGPPFALEPLAVPGSDRTTTPLTYDDDRITAALERAGWNRRKAAALLGISHMTFYRWLERDAHLRELLDSDPAALRQRVQNAAGDLELIARELQTTVAVLVRLLARKR
ncbi:MAG TPA: sigma 54-interacting transcriptional regulator [Polyangia bacterium]|nr:sigma 54-interacting transcriptional regulator [Polyangia bacterium]